MAISGTTLVQRTRRYLRDWPELDQLTASCSSSATSLTVADGTRYSQHELLEIDQEVLRCTANGSGTTVSVQRGLRGSTAASHASSSTVLMRPAFFAVEILDELNEGLGACFPRLYRPVVNDYTGIADSTYEYTLPNMSGLSVPIPYVYEVRVQDPGDTPFRLVRDWDVERADAPFLRFRSALIGGSTLRVQGYGPFTPLASVSDTLDPLFPAHAQFLPSLFASAALLASGEAGRVRSDTGVIDQREQANRVGSSMSASSGLLQRFYSQLERAAMPPMPRPLRSTF